MSAPRFDAISARKRRATPQKNLHLAPTRRTRFAAAPSRGATNLRESPVLESAYSVTFAP
jgi:hypothetical protein